MPASPGRTTRRRSSAPVQASVPARRIGELPAGRGSNRPTFLTLRDHGKVYVADLPRLSDGQLIRLGKEAREVHESLSRRLQELENPINLTAAEQETRIRATTKRTVTERFLEAVDEELAGRSNNPALRAASGESLARAFLELARHRLPGSTFDSLLQEALTACDGHDRTAEQRSPLAGCAPAVLLSVSRPSSLPVVLPPEGGPGSEAAQEPEREAPADGAQSL